MQCSDLLDKGRFVKLKRPRVNNSGPVQNTQNSEGKFKTTITETRCRRKSRQLEMVEKINKGEKKSANKSKWQKNRYGLMQFSFILTLNTVKKDVNNSVEFFESAPDQLDNKSRFFLYIYLCGFYLFIVVIKLSGFTSLAIQTSSLWCAV